MEACFASKRLSPKAHSLSLRLDGSRDFQPDAQLLSCESVLFRQPECDRVPKRMQLKFTAMHPSCAANHLILSLGNSLTPVKRSMPNGSPKPRASRA